MNRRKETRTVTRAVETRIEFSAADLRKRLRLPDDAVLGLLDPKGLVTGDDSLNDLGLSATFSRSTTKGAE